MTAVSRGSVVCDLSRHVRPVIQSNSDNITFDSLFLNLKSVLIRRPYATEYGFSTPAEIRLPKPSQFIGTTALDSLRSTHAFGLKNVRVGSVPNRYTVFGVLG